MKDTIKLNELDNVVIALKDILRDDIIPMGHKIANKDILKGEMIIKYGMPIGKATKDILKGENVHINNIKTNLDKQKEYSYKPKLVDTKSNIKDRTVNVYKRENSEYGIRNELWIIPTVGCVNKVASKIIDQFKKHIDYNENNSIIDGIFSFSHSYGCSQIGDDHINTRVSLQDIVKNPNAGGVLVLGLGCENNQIDEFIDTLGEYDKNRVRFLVTQDVNDEIEEGIKLLKQLYNNMLNDRREEKPLSVLKIGLECGGSDGLSGITANPLLGDFSDYLISNGGTTVLTEIPEMFGAETILMDRCINKEVFKKTVNMINDFKNYYKINNQTIYENPSPGNKKGGISTLEDKSLGCIQKAGKSNVIDVLEYGQRLKNNGLNLLSAPGNDLIATTALGMSGCQLVLFTTGRGTPFGGFIPTMKISTNTALANKKNNWIDFDAGVLVEGISMSSLLEQFIDEVIDIVNGKKAKNEINDYRDIAIFKSGVTL